MEHNAIGGRSKWRRVSTGLGTLPSAFQLTSLDGLEGQRRGHGHLRGSAAAAGLGGLVQELQVLVGLTWPAGAVHPAPPRGGRAAARGSGGAVVPG